jgi:hypothetical protein
MTSSSTPTIAADPARPGAPGEAGRHRHRGWLVPTAVVGGLACLAVVVLAATFLLRDEPGTKPLGEAVEEFRESGPATSGTGGIGLPAAGVYLAIGEGSGRLSFPPLAQRDGDTMPVTLTHGSDSCWTLTVDFNEVHRQTWDYCTDPSGSTVVETGGQTFQRWDLGATTLDNTSTFGCTPPVLAHAVAAEVGSTWDQVCVGTNSDVAGTTRTAGTYTFVADEQLVIDGVEVDVHRYRQAREITGAQTGHQQTEIWIETASGMPVRAERNVRVDSESPVGTITYSEQGWWQLSSMEPNT